MLQLRDRLLAPFHIESALLEHPDIIEAVACDIEGFPTRVDDQVELHRIRLYLIQKDEASLDEAQVIDFLSGTHPELPLIDGGVAFVDAIPKTTVRRVVSCMVMQVNRDSKLTSCSLESQTTETYTRSARQGSQPTSLGKVSYIAAQGRKQILHYSQPSIRINFLTPFSDTSGELGLKAIGWP